jgi:hypothetical protein
VSPGFRPVDLPDDFFNVPQIERSSVAPVRVDCALRYGWVPKAIKEFGQLESVVNLKSTNGVVKLEILDERVEQIAIGPERDKHDSTGLISKRARPRSRLDQE